MVDPCFYHSDLLKDPGQVIALFYQILQKLKVPRFRPYSELCSSLLSVYNKFDFPQFSTNVSYESRYIPSEDRIFILDEKYTIRTALHELLHAFSVYAKDFENFKKRFEINKYIHEGHTEFLTGLILYLYFPSCYEIWQEFYPHYEIGDLKRTIGHDTNSDWTKIWLSVAYHYDLRKVIDSYFSYTTNTIDELFSELKSAQIGFLIEMEDKEAINIHLENLFDDHAEFFEKPDHLDYTWLDDNILRAKIDRAPIFI